MTKRIQVAFLFPWTAHAGNGETHVVRTTTGWLVTHARFQTTIASMFMSTVFHEDGRHVMNPETFKYGNQYMGEVDE